MHCGLTWQPTKLIRVVDSFNSNSTKPLHVTTDQGDAIVKFIGNPQGPDALAFELVGTELARWMGLKTPDFATLRLENIPEEWSPSYTIENGRAFLSRYLKGMTYEGSQIFLEKLSHPDDIAKLVVFDTWIRNEDRYPPDYALLEKPQNLDNLLFVRNHDKSRSLKYDLIAFDHTHAFTDAGYIGLEDPALIDTEAVYGFFPAFKTYMERSAIKSATDRLHMIDEGEVKALLDALPSEWGPSNGVKRAWCNLICQRAKFVAETIEAKIIYQMELLEGGEDVG